MIAATVAIFCIAAYKFFLDLTKKVAEYNAFSSKGVRKVVMGAYNVSFIISDKNPCKIFSANSKPVLFMYWT